MTYSEEYEIIMGKVLNYLSYGNKSTFQTYTKVKEYLKKIDIEDEKKILLEEEVINRLKDLDFLNDKKILDTIFLNHQNSSKNLSKLKIKKSLIKRGFKTIDIQPYLDKLPVKYEKEALLKDLNKKLRTTNNKNKLIKYLLQKGYRYDLIINEVDLININ